MNCDCVEKVNTKLRDAGHPYQLAPSLIFDEKMQMESLLTVDTRWVGEPPKRKEEQAATVDDLYSRPDEGEVLIYSYEVLDGELGPPPDECLIAGLRTKVEPDFDKGTVPFLS